jgi:hypothetical protein
MLPIVRSVGAREVQHEHHRRLSLRSGTFLEQRCPDHHTHLLVPRVSVHRRGRSDRHPHLTFVRVGALDDPELAPPVVTAWTASAPSWACFDERLPQVERQPPPAA